MTQDELQKLYESCMCETTGLNPYKYNDAIRAKNGRWFSHNKKDYIDKYAMYGTINAITYIKQLGFIILEDPYSKNMNYVGWVVFPPITLKNLNDENN